MTRCNRPSLLLVGEIRAEMARQRKTTTALAAVIGRSQSTASNRLSGTQPFTFDELIQVCEWLGVSVTELDAEAERHSRRAS
ncbi:helix-turn-helix domain-containing protein [Nocardia brasiliensis]|uniref:helix-turn-helix domain-containing protein n=1 Tax=Nocardia brasiliensis TaxID=37326 RepID=UPI0024563852|nr:helix-turn-helix transcriptional regulator [Nocardia brasiliensis]